MECVWINSGSLSLEQLASRYTGLLAEAIYVADVTT